ncbi:MAG TPA: BON domain-containing protein [Actinomycetota bacterium]|nr:BON domain-containing protein [Actinomycetota bacterium]
MPERDRVHAAEDVYEAAHLSELLANDLRTSAPELRVTVGGGVVTITGTVTTEERRDAVAEVIGEAHPELDVRNDVTVIDLSGPPSSEVVR